MKKIFIYLIAILMLVIPMQTGRAVSEFSLINGQMASGGEWSVEVYGPLFKNTRITAVYSPQQDNYTLTGEGVAESTYDDPTYVRLDTSIINISGTYDPLTGGFSGSFHLDVHSDGKTKDKARLDDFFYQHLLADGELTAIANPGDKSVKMLLNGTGDSLMSGKVDMSFTVTFDVQGALPFTQEPGETQKPMITEEPEKTEEPNETENKPEDSNIRIKEVATTSGNVYIRRAGAEKTEIADQYTVINVGDTIIVPKNGYGVILKLNSYKASEFFLRAGTELKIREKQKVEAFGECFLKLGDKIAEWFTDEERNEDFGIETNRANTSIKGTIVVIKDDGETSCLKVIEGTAEFTSKLSGESVMVRTGEMISATEEGLGEIEEFDVEAEMEDWAEYGAVMPQEDFPLWAILAIGGVVILAAVVVIIAVYSRRKKRLAGMACPSAPLQGEYPPASGLFCTQCGEPLEPGVAFCAKCGKKT